MSKLLVFRHPVMQMLEVALESDNVEDPRWGLSGGPYHLSLISPPSSPQRTLTTAGTETAPKPRPTDPAGRRRKNSRYVPDPPPRRTASGPDRRYPRLPLTVRLDDGVISWSAAVCGIRPSFLNLWSSSCFCLLFRVRAATVQP